MSLLNSASSVDSSTSVQKRNVGTLVRPPWLKVRAPTGENYTRLKKLIDEERLHTVCSSASCPNMGECWELGTATFMIMGNQCTRACRFCHVDTSARPKPLDLDEPKRLAYTAAKMNLNHVVITSVARDDLPDGGAHHFAQCIQAVREILPHANIEVLVPDFGGNESSIEHVLNAKPVIFNHNLETVRRLTRKIRSKATYDRSLQVLATAKKIAPSIKTKSGIMLGLGEELDEVHEALRDMRTHHVDILTIGQYLQPSPWHHKIDRYVSLEEFAHLKSYANTLGFAYVESGPLVRSSYHAEKATQV